MDAGGEVSPPYIGREVSPFGDIYLLFARAGLTWWINNGMVEGQVTKLKLIKRQGYGRAGFPLLRKRVLHAVLGRTSQARVVAWLQRTSKDAVRPPARALRMFWEALAAEAAWLLSCRTWLTHPSAICLGLGPLTEFTSALAQIGKSAESFTANTTSNELWS